MTVKVISSLEEAREELASVSSVVAKSQHIIAAGGMIDMADLQRHVMSLCGAIETMDREETKDLMPELMQLLSYLNKMEETLFARLGHGENKDDAVTSGSL